MTSPTGSLASAVAGFRLLFEGARLLVRERRLWGPALVPLLLSLAAFASAIGVLVAYAGELHAFATDWMPVLEASRWYAWLWIGPAKLGLAVLGALLFLAIAGACLVAAYVVASVIAAPFHDVLSARVERVEIGALDDRARSGLLGSLSEALRSLREELRKMGFFAAVVAPLWVIGLLVPAAQLVTAPAILAFTIFFLPLDYTSYTLDRRHVSFRDRWRWLLAHVARTAGFGGAAFLACALPGLNLFAMPLLVVAGTLLAVRHGPASSQAAEAASPARHPSTGRAAPRSRA